MRPGKMYLQRLLGLLTHRKVKTLAEAQAVYHDGRLRHRIEDAYRLLQEAGLAIEQVMVHTLARMQRMFVAALGASVGNHQNFPLDIPPSPAILSAGLPFPTLSDRAGRAGYRPGSWSG